MRSPLTNGGTEVVFEILRRRLAEIYRSAYDIDVLPYLGETDPIRCYRCVDTGFEFFDPPTLAGPPEFYADLYGTGDHEEWAYQPQKWEYDIARQYVTPGARILDIGCGGGDFLALLGEDVPKTGLETSPFGLTLSRKKGIDVVNSTIEDHSVTHTGMYDVVTALQVLEHVASAKSFLDAASRVVAPGGHLIIAVPNNDAFLGDDYELALNLPPHHMGRWRRHSLEAVAKLFGLVVKTIEYEPLAEHNLAWYQADFEKRYLPKSRLIRSLWYRLGFNTAFSEYLRNARNTVHGHTILAVYSKPSA